MTKQWEKIKFLEETLAATIKTAMDRQAEIEGLWGLITEVLGKLQMCAMEDCEHGIRSVNEKAAENYLKEYPHTLDAILDSRKMISDAISGAIQKPTASVAREYDPSLRLPMAEGARVNILATMQGEK